MEIELDKFKQDYNWRAAFSEAVRGGYHCYVGEPEEPTHPVENVNKVFHASEGENDEADWIAVVGWDGNEGPFAVMVAGCDYTGWD